MFIQFAFFFAILRMTQYVMINIKNRRILRHPPNNLKNSLNVLKFEGVREIQSGKNHQCPTNPFGQNGYKILKYRPCKMS